MAQWLMRPDEGVIYTHNKVCEMCQTPFSYDSKVKAANRKYCSHKCRKKAATIAIKKSGTNKAKAERFRSLQHLQNDVCAVCGASGPLYRDYTDEGQPRGMICQRCSRGLHLVGDNLKELVSYVGQFDK